MSEFDDETLMAFADGELDEKTRQAIERAMDSDEVLVERVALFIRTAALSKQALDPLLDQPVPEALRASVTAMVEETDHTAGDTVVPFTGAGAPGRRGSIPLGTANGRRGCACCRRPRRLSDRTGAG